jgi:gliding motility-associated-like protein
MKLFRKYLFLIVFLEALCISGQNSASQWYFGNNAGLNFLTNPPTILTNGALTPSNSFLCGEGCSAISNSSGSILFYSDGGTIWNQNHVPMANGTGLSGDWSSCQSSIILPMPGSTNLFYIFTVPSAGTGSVCYSVVDMNLASGSGSVISKNNFLMTNNTEKITATKHCNGVDYWIVCRSTGTNFNSYLLNSTGVSNTVVSTVCCPPNGGSAGGLKKSPNGNKLADAEGFTGMGVLTLYDFNNSTGAVTNPIVLPMTGPYSCEFSPDGSKLYGSGNSRIIQFDLCPPTFTSPTTYTVSMLNGNTAQLAPNGKIYIGQGFQVSVINNPNVFGAGCGFVQYGQSISPKTACLGLPNFPSNLFYKKPLPNPFTYTASTSFGCYGAQFTANLTNSLSTCAAASSTVSGVAWNFGDPMSGSANMSFQNNPTHNFSSNGNYTVQLVLYYACGIANDTLRQTVNINQSCISTISNSITCASLGSATITGAVGIGPFTYTWLPSNQTGSVATNLNPGTHTVVVFDSGANQTFTATTFFASVVPLNGTLSASSSLSCNSAFTGTAAINNISGGSPSQTYLWTNGTQSTSIASPTNLSAGNWSVTVTDALTACQINSVFTISQPPPLSLTLSAASPTACAGTSIALTGSNSGGTPGFTYTWTNAPPSASVVASESLAGNYVYTLSSLDANNCLATNTIALNFIANPTISVANVSVCPLAVGTLTAAGAGTYTWTAPITSTSTSNLLSVTYSDVPSVTTQYTVIGSALGCTATATASIVLHALPVPVLQTNPPRCENTSLFVNASGGTMYQWSGPNAFSSFLPSNSFTSAILNNAGLYNVTVTSVNGCTAAANVSVTVNPIPPVSAQGSTVCTSQTITLFGNSVPGASYLWSGPIGFSSNQQNPTIANPTLNRTGSYLVKATSAQGCTNSAVAQVSVVTPPSLTLVLSSSSLCSQAFNGSPNTITLTSSGANTYTLYTPNLIGSSTAAGPTTSLASVPPFSNTLSVGNATMVGSNGVCVNSSTFNFTVIPNPTVGVNSYTPIICAGQNFTYTSNSANSYTWSASTPNYTTYSNGGVAVAHPSINAVFSVFGSSLGCNSALVTSSITVYPLPVFTLTAASPSICLFEKTIITASGTGQSYQWLPSTGLNTTNSISVIANPIAAQNYTVIASANNCTNTATILLTVLTLPIPIINNTNAKVCVNDSVRFSGAGGQIYSWLGPNNFGLSGRAVSFLASSQKFAGTYTLSITDIKGCKNSTLTSIEVLPLPSGSLLDFKEEACAPYCKTYSFLGANSKSIQSTWQINKTNYTGNVFNVCLHEAGTYSFTGKIQDVTTSCKAELSYILNLHEKPKADFNFAPLKPIEGLDEVQFTNTSSGNELTKFNWYFTDNNGFSAKTKNTSYLYNEAGTFPIVLVAENKYACKDTVLKVITVASDFALYVPNTFTPNDDSRNDVFVPVARAVKLYDLKIYDRWGQEVFHSKALKDGWDGTYKGAACKQDVYTWVLELSSVNGEHVLKTGTVTLIR